MDETPASREPSATPPEPAGLTVGAMWRLSLAGALVALFVLGAIAIAFDVPGLRRALDLRRLFR